MRLHSSRGVIPICRGGILFAPIFVSSPEVALVWAGVCNSPELVFRYRQPSYRNHCAQAEAPILDGHK